MAKVLCVLAIALIVAVSIEAQCPSSSRVTSCSPKCTENSQCSSVGGTCCPNICNAKSCVLANQFGGGNKDRYESGKTSGAGTYCGNLKCNSFEKCEMDRSTHRMKCVRA